MPTTPPSKTALKNRAAVHDAHGRIRVLAVGVAEYPAKSGFNPLAQCASDAWHVRTAFADTPQLNADPDYLVLLSSKIPDRLPTRGHILAQLSELANSTSHPADAARMDVVLDVLRGNGWNSDANAIEREWGAMLSLGGFEATAEYRRCFPGSLLQDIARGAAPATSAIGCMAASPDRGAAIGTLLNDAWKQFWADPLQYGRWQEQATQRLDPVAARTLASV